MDPGKFKKKFEKKKKEQQQQLLKDQLSAMLHSFFANDEEKKEESDDEEDSKLEEAIGGWDDKDEGSVAADQIKSKGISFDTTCNDYFEENIERLLDDNLSLIKANRFIPMEEADELSDVDLSENDEDDIDEVAATSEEEVEIKKIASEDTKDEIKAIIHNSTKDSEMRHNQPQVERGQSLEVPTVGEEATPETDKKEEDNNEAFGEAEPNTSILSLFLAEIEEGSSDNTSEETSAEEVTEIPKPRPMHREPNTIFSNQDLKSLAHQYELKRIDLIDSEDDKFDEAIGGPIEISCHSSKIESLPKRQVTWEEDSLTTNRDQPDSSKAYKKNGKNIKKKKEKKAKKSRFSCLIGCFYPNVHHDEEYDADCNLTMISHPRAPMWGLLGTQNYLASHPKDF
ncbi:uncharacterized protein [Halyomorpha halys]|uniref:uncharacterized protein isoform X2 n=1 Tax=Halyomorpha halys TaxID=286706 RepID=UPI0006D4FAF3